MGTLVPSAADVAVAVRAMVQPPAADAQSGVVRRPQGAPGALGAPGAEKAHPSPFDDVLAQELGHPPVRLSQHAQERLQTSGVTLGANEMRRLGQAVDVAASKGARQSLVLLDGTALVVSVRNRTVVTAVSGERMHDNVFTNIDSAVIAGDASR